MKYREVLKITKNTPLKYKKLFCEDNNNLNINMEMQDTASISNHQRRVIPNPKMRIHK